MLTRREQLVTELVEPFVADHEFLLRVIVEPESIALAPAAVAGSCRRVSGSTPNSLQPGKDVRSQP
jgi:hypothetical protein